MRDLDDLAASAGRTAAALRTAQMTGVRKAALHVTTEIRSEIRRVTGDMRLSGVGAKGTKVGAKYDIKGTVNPTALITATGPLHLIERDTDAHTIPRSGGRRRKRKTLKFDGSFRRSTFHPGTSGQHPFAKGVAKGAVDAPRIFQAEVRKAVVKAWGIS